MSIFNQFRVKPGTDVRLGAIDPDFSGTLAKDVAHERTRRNEERLRQLQELLYAEHKRAILICLQAMDAGGKDGVIAHVMGATNPQSCRVASFKKPNTQEQEHDFLWRASRELPAIGELVIFNRSHYESVLIERVHKLVPAKVINQRYEEINAFEKHLGENYTHVLKFFLHISKDEQLKRFKTRLDDPTKHWKISENDYTERDYWKDYQKAFEAMLTQCSSKAAPWFIIPANHKWFRDYAVSEILVQYMEGLRMKFPPPQVNIAKVRKLYRKEAGKA